MSELFDNLCTGILLKDLGVAVTVLEKIDISTAEPRGVSVSKQLGDLIYVVRSFDDLATTERRHPSLHFKFRSPNALLHLRAVLKATAAIIDECTPLVRSLQSGVEGLKHERDLAGYVRTENRLENQSWYGETYQALRLLTELLRALFTAINVLQYQDDAEEYNQSLQTRSSTAALLHYQIGLVERRLHYPSQSDTRSHFDNQYDSEGVREALRAAKAVVVFMPNQYFVIPRQVRSYYTGREAQLAKLEAAFHDPALPIQQVFVIYGLSGSGKTELALKFAEEYGHRFWGIFYVDGSSEKHAATSYATIATLGGVAPNEKAAKNWLVTRGFPWLLIIDNVDEEKIRIQELLPQGAKGCCIITTRNPSHIIHGNVGDKYLELLPMEPEEAETLIIKAAGVRKPWPAEVVDSARAICHALGFLPLALDQAAKAIRHGICEWAEYLIYFDRQIRRIRRNLHSRARSGSREREQIQEDSSSINVFSTYEILYESLVSSPKERYQDAVELLHVFSYFHFQNIRLGILINSATNPLKEEEQQRQDEEQLNKILKKLDKPPRKPWTMFIRELRAFANTKLTTPLPLPGVLRNRERLGLSALEDEVQVRLRQALGVLLERSLVMRQDRTTGQYSMHRLVHKWVRERPEMSTSHQALWCQISMSTLAFSIRRPPHGETEDEGRARRELLPHIRHACERQKDIEHRLEENAISSGRRWPVTKRYGRLEAEQDVRFSRVYRETGHFDEARELQERALKFVAGRLGPDHPIAIGLSLLVSQSLWEMSAIDMMTQRLRQTRQLCVDTWGEDYPLTLDVTDLLGSALYFKGRWSEARALHICNTEKMKRLYGEKNEKTLKSIRNTARLHYRWMNYEEATELYLISWNGMKEILGETHLETLFSLEDLAMSYVRYGADEQDPRREEHLALSCKYMKFVYEQRKGQLGPEHHFTLLSILYFARAKSETGLHSEAEAMIRDALIVAERNIPKEHLAFLLAKTIYAQILTRLKKYAEAESLFSMLIDKAQYKRLVDEDGEHPDRLSILWFLVLCLEEQGKFEEAIQRCQELRIGLGIIGGQGAGMRHKMLMKVQEKIPWLQERAQPETLL